MPYTRSGKCVYKKKTDGSQGKKKGCSDSEEKAKKYMSKLYSLDETDLDETDPMFLGGGATEEEEDPMGEALLRKWVQETLLEKSSAKLLKKDLSAELMRKISALNLPEVLSDITWDKSAPINFIGGDNIRFRVGHRSRADRDSVTNKLLPVLKSKAEQLGLVPGSIKKSKAQATIEANFQKDPSTTVKFLVKPGGAMSSADLGDIYEGNITDLFKLILSLGGYPDEMVHFEAAGSGHGSDIQISAMAKSKPLFKMEAKNTTVPELGSRAMAYDTSEDRYVVKPTSQNAATEAKSPGITQLFQDALDEGTVVLTKLDAPNRAAIIKAVLDRVDAAVKWGGEKDPFVNLVPSRDTQSMDKVIFRYDPAPFLVGPNLAEFGPDTWVGEIILEEFRKAVWPGNTKDATAPVSVDGVGDYYALKGDDFIQIAEKGLYSLKNDWQLGIAPSFQSSLSDSSVKLRMRLRPNNLTFRAGITVGSNWISESDVNLTSPSRLVKGEIGASSLDDDATLVAQMLAASLGLDLEEMLTQIDFETTPMSELIRLYGSGEETPSSWPPEPERDIDEGIKKYAKSQMRLMEARQYANSQLSILKERLIVEELSGADRSEIKRMIKKEIEGTANKREIEKAFSKKFEKELKKALGASFLGTPGKINKFVVDQIYDEVNKWLADTATRNEIAEITKQVLVKLYRELSFSSPTIIKRIKV